MAFQTGYGKLGDTDWQSASDALIHIHFHLSGPISQDTSTRSINFMCYELITLCQNKVELDVFHTLNDFFFRSKRFQVSHQPIFIEEILDKRAGCGIALALLYMHLAKQVDLDLQLIQWPLHTVLKWQSKEKSYFIDLEENGKVLSEDELLKMISEHYDKITTLTLNQAAIQYLSYISTRYRQTDDLESLHKVLNLILKLDPENTRILVERAILRRDLGLVKESLSDFKRYFSFTDITTASPDVISVFETVRILNKKVPGTFL